MQVQFWEIKKKYNRREKMGKKQKIKDDSWKTIGKKY